MKITEIEYGHWNKPSIPENITIPKNAIGTFDGLDIHSMTQNNQLYFLILNSDSTFKGYISVDSKFHFHEAYVNEKYRRQGICSMLVLFVLRELNKKLVLSFDEIITEDSRQLFFKLAQTNKIKISHKGQVLDTKSLGEIFINISDNDIELVIESKQRKSSQTCNEIRNPETSLSEIQVTSFEGTIREAFWYD